MNDENNIVALDEVKNAENPYKESQIHLDETFKNSDIQIKYEKRKDVYKKDLNSYNYTKQEKEQIIYLLMQAAKLAVSEYLRSLSHGNE